MKAWMAAVAMAGALASGGVMADGNKLLDACQAAIRFNDTKKADEEVSIGYCLGLMQGVRSLIMYTNTGIPIENQTCLPLSGISNGQAARVVVKYLKENPEQLHQDEGILTLLVLKHAFPCK
ncbi:Rap1a/Tai family immunity protein [Pseudomonas sp. 14A]|uniref:Rap1a/Tai family immunity protein n=1 Tax=Pseudomonas sp. 14A TaxID=2823142 RepID=UPI001B842423|nr:Rap1a/Tai family immunity protein [Pseudomonas sp. 14A]MBR7196473.1 hypothetical protein [Pseudomonas sp. 14A]